MVSLRVSAAFVIAAIAAAFLTNCGGDDETAEAAEETEAERRDEEHATFY